MKKKSLKTIWIMFGIFMILFSLNLGVKGFMTATQRMWLIMDIWAIVLSIILLIKYKIPSRKSIVVSIVLGLLVSLSYIKVGGFSLVLAVGVVSIIFLCFQAMNLKLILI